MFVYHMRLAWLSFRRTPLLSSLIVGAIGLGIGVFISILTVYALMVEDPAPGYSGKLFTYKLHNQPELAAGNTSNTPQPMVGYRDAMNLYQSDIPRRHSLHYQTSAVIFPDGAGQLPSQQDIRLANAGFFEVHRVPFLYGNAWTDRDEVSDPFQTILTKKLNEELFGGANSVGENLRIGPNSFTVVGVLDEFKPIPMYLETDGGAFGTIEGALIPFSLTPQLSMRKRGGSTRCRADPAEDTWLSFLEAECNWIHHWVELGSEADVEDFRQLLNNYAMEQRQVGRFLGPFEHELHDVLSWLEDRSVVNQDYRILLSVAFLFLVVCLLNCIGLLLAKFLGKAGEMSLRRAVGGSRKMIFRQHLVEIGLIGFLGGLLGLGISLLGLVGIRYLYRSYEQLTHLNLQLVLVAILMAVISTMLAGLFPAWRVCHLPVSQNLKSQ